MKEAQDAIFRATISNSEPRHCSLRVSWHNKNKKSQALAPNYKSRALRLFAIDTMEEDKKMIKLVSGRNRRAAACNSSRGECEDDTVSCSGMTRGVSPGLIPVGCQKVDRNHSNPLLAIQLEHYGVPLLNFISASHVIPAAFLSLV